MRQRNLSIFNFKKFLIKFFIPFILVVGGFGFVFQRYIVETDILNDTTSGQYKINRILNPRNTDEIPMFGSSRMKEIVMPSILGKRYFNYGIEGTGANVNLFFLTQELKKVKSGPILINFDLEGLNYDLGELDSYLYNIDYSSVQNLLQKEDKYYYHIDILKYYGFYKKYMLDYVSKLSKNSKGTLIDRGALLYYPSSTKSQQVHIGIKTGSKIYFKNSPELLSLLKSLILAHPERMFIYVIPPYHTSYINNFSNENTALKFFSYLRSFKNVRVLNYSRIVYPDNHFMDSKHLNYIGALKFSKTLRDTLDRMEKLNNF